VPGDAICSWDVASWPPVGWDYAGGLVNGSLRGARLLGWRLTFAGYRGVSRWGFAVRYSFSSVAINRPAEYGEYVSGPRVVNDATRAEMKQILADIQSGKFAKEWMLENRVNQTTADRRHAAGARQHVRHHIRDVRAVRASSAWYGVAGGMRVEELLVHHRVERLEVALDHRAEALVFEAEDLLLAHCQILLCSLHDALELRYRSCGPVYDAMLDVAAPWLATKHN
jgi:hypothetical protein